MGARIGAWVEEQAGAGIHYTRMPWGALATNMFNLTPSNAVACRLKRVYAEWAGKSKAGRLTPAGAGAEDRQQRRRRSDDPQERSQLQRMSSLIGFELLQWFVDEIESLTSRGDSSLMLEHAVWLRSQLLQQGQREEDLPKIHKGWLYLWRKEHGISIRQGTTHFQVSYAKALDRVRCMFGNIFRLRHHWSRCHPGTAMRWFSADQKPSWMNNAGRRPMYARRGSRRVAAKENHAATRDRYTILTCVQSWQPLDGAVPPVAVLFKAQSGARLRQELQVPPWMHLQFQEKGSYRADDVMDALGFALQPAAKPEDSIVILLDWYSAHLTAEVQQAIRDMGHVVLYHGGGVTGLEQINDTHFHALVQRLMEQIETRVLHKQRQEDPSKIASLSRQDVIDAVAEMWMSLDHRGLSEKGYRQTGPLLGGDAVPEDVFVDLRPFWEALGGPALWRHAQQTVDEMWSAGTLSSWADVDLLIEHHKPHPCAEEGLEGANWEVVPDEEEEDDDGGDDPGEGGGGAAAAAAPSPSGAAPPSTPANASAGSGAAPSGAAPGGAAGGSAPLAAPCRAARGAPAPGASDADDDWLNDGGSLTEGAGPGGGGALPGEAPEAGPAGLAGDGGAQLGGAERDSGGAEPGGAPEEGPGDLAGDHGGVCTEAAYLSALNHVMVVAQQTRNDRFLKSCRAELQRSHKKRRTYDAPEAQRLRRAAKEAQRLREADRQAAREAERERQAAERREEVRVVDAKRQATEARMAALDKAAAARREANERLALEATRRAKERWLQVDYPVMLAERLVAWRRRLPPPEATALQDRVRRLVGSSRVERTIRVPELWVDDKTLTAPRLAASMGALVGPRGARTRVLCTREFEWTLFGQAWATEGGRGGAADAAAALRRLINQCAPGGADLFRRRWQPPALLETCGMVAPKALVYAIILLSTWLGPEAYPEGVHEWPPAIPAAVTAG
ncbi:unnamed protein product [Prorocentrum cordatum]|uniref:DDE-1 domain-containing protein n=1 Tax=Prorocentrum cordatum TaxID=2364126 RepID=A0ABN9YDN0_9DINO|nr:unnamed protein product [Polarella glacialis]